MIPVVQLGTLTYAEGLRTQQKLVELRKAGQIGDVLLLLEHSPVITLGRNARASNVLASTQELAARGVEVFDCDRGGDVTFHGPGQIVGYPIFDLRQHEPRKCGAGAPARETASARKTLGVIDYVRQLEEVLIRTCRDFDIPTRRVAGLTGVWTEPSPCERNRKGHDFSRADTRGGERAALAAEGRPEAKIAAIGVHISRSVTSHGFALNVNTDLSFFDLIVPCGITAKPVTSMQKELGRKPDMDAVAESIFHNFSVVFSSQMLWIQTLDALLAHTVGVPMKVPSKLREMHEEREDDLFLA